jgi:hypothetical protein
MAAVQVYQQDIGFGLVKPRRFAHRGRRQASLGAGNAEPVCEAASLGLRRRSENGYVQRSSLRQTQPAAFRFGVRPDDEDRGHAAGYASDHAPMQRFPEA